MIRVGDIKYKKFTTIVKMTNKVKEFLISKNINLSLHKKLSDEKYWYEHILFEKLDDNEDGIPDEKYGCNFELIYCSIIESHEDYQPREQIIKNLGLHEELIVHDGSIIIQDKEPFLGVRWIVVKSGK